jgi:hypothetical protein
MDHDQSYKIVQTSTKVRIEIIDFLSHLNLVPNKGRSIYNKIYHPYIYSPNFHPYISLFQGRSIFSTKSVQPDETIFEEKPLVSCQFSWNKAYKYLAW